MKDIENSNDIELLVNEFYRKVREDKVVGYIFNDVVKINWNKHLPLMYDFWDNAILFSGKYEGNPMNLHKHLHHIKYLDSTHFSRWVQLFLATVDELFEGPKAALAKKRANNISVIMQEKILLHQINPGIC